MKLPWPFRTGSKPDIRASSPENPATPLSAPDSWLSDLFGARSIAGPSVSETTAMRQSTVFRCVSIIAGVIANLPLNVYRRTASGREEAVDHDLYELLRTAPCDLMSAFTWKEIIGANVLLAGNHYSVIERTQGGKVLGFVPIVPQQVQVRRIAGRNRYYVTLEDGQEILDQDEILHIPGIGFDGIRGLSPIAWAGRQPVGIALALEEHVGRMHSNGVHPSGTLEVPAKIEKPSFDRLRAQFEALYAGVGNAGRTVILDQGSKWTPMSISPVDAQTLDERRFQVADICRIFGVPPHMVGETDKSTAWGTGIEQQVIGFQKFSVDPHLTRIESEINRKILMGSGFYAEFDRQAMNALDSKAEAELFASGIMNAWLMPNEVRRRKNLPDQPGGDTLFIQSTLIPVSQAEQARAPATPAAKPQMPDQNRGAA